MSIIGHTKVIVSYFISILGILSIGLLNSCKPGGSSKGSQVMAFDKKGYCMALIPYSEKIIYGKPNPDAKSPNQPRCLNLESTKYTGLRFVPKNPSARDFDEKNPPLDEDAFLTAPNPLDGNNYVIGEYKVYDSGLRVATLCERSFDKSCDLVFPIDEKGKVGDFNPKIHLQVAQKIEDALSTLVATKRNEKQETNIISNPETEKEVTKENKEKPQQSEESLSTNPEKGSDPEANNLSDNTTETKKTESEKEPETEPEKQTVESEITNASENTKEIEEVSEEKKEKSELDITGAKITKVQEENKEQEQEQEQEEKAIEAKTVSIHLASGDSTLYKTSRKETCFKDNTDAANLDVSVERLSEIWIDGARVTFADPESKNCIGCFISQLSTSMDSLNDKQISSKPGGVLDIHAFNKCETRTKEIYCTAQKFRKVISGSRVTVTPALLATVELVEKYAKRSYTYLQSASIVEENSGSPVNSDSLKNKTSPLKDIICK